MIYVAALALGPLVGSFAGGVGASLSDLIYGLWFYAPATLIIKAFEGAIVGTLGKKKPQGASRSYWKAFTSGIGVLLAALLAVTGYAYIGDIYLLGYLVIPSVFWVVLAIIVGVSVAAGGFLVAPDAGWLALSTIIGGLIMITGYFVYEYFFLYALFGIRAFAVVDIAVNVAQMLIGTIIAVPIVKVIQKRLPQLHP